ncbi:MAG TPA: signal recognition particle-docking protein FtsY, partial [Leuconostoc citreum]|nr:signal recognition particle-docking protein FtsY [Leuconostoc citreum]
MGLFDIFRKKKTDNQEEESSQQASRVSSESRSDQTSDQLLEEQHDVQLELDKSEAPVVKSPETETETE